MISIVLVDGSETMTMLLSVLLAIIQRTCSSLGTGLTRYRLGSHNSRSVGGRINGCDG
ncbi:MAG: hypothetical protein OXI87_18380 [Albidovulum sp.]|nr:hypothetical protein [Albidovulum sp.]MDE0530696.1 hypothetical protein [Albidovulum sp.]